MKHPNPYADFFLANTHAFEVEPGHEALIYSSGDDSLTPWATHNGKHLLVYASTRNELIALHNASVGGTDSMGAQYLPGWPWRILLDDLPAATSSNRMAFRFPGQDSIKAATAAA